MERQACSFCHGACADARRGVPAVAPRLGRLARRKRGLAEDLAASRWRPRRRSPLLRHHQLHLSPMTSSPPSDLQSAREMAMSGSGSTIVRRSAGQPLAAAYEARNVFITNLPEVLLLHVHRLGSATSPVARGHAWRSCQPLAAVAPLPPCLTSRWRSSPAVCGRSLRVCEDSASFWQRLGNGHGHGKAAT